MAQGQFHEGWRELDVEDCARMIVSTKFFYFILDLEYFDRAYNIQVNEHFTRGFGN